MLISLQSIGRMRQCKKGQDSQSKTSKKRVSDMFYHDRIFIEVAGARSEFPYVSNLQEKLVRCNRQTDELIKCMKKNPLFFQGN